MIFFHFNVTNSFSIAQGSGINIHVVNGVVTMLCVAYTVMVGNLIKNIIKGPGCRASQTGILRTV